MQVVRTQKRGIHTLFWKKLVLSILVKIDKSKKELFWTTKSTFYPYEHHYVSPFPTLKTIFKFLKWRFFAFFSQKILKNWLFFVLKWYWHHFWPINILGFGLFEKEPQRYKIYLNWTTHFNCIKHSLPEIVTSY